MAEVAASAPPPEASSKVDFSKRHPLEHNWTLWYRAGSDGGSKRQKDYEDSIREVFTFGTVEDFWW